MRYLVFLSIIAFIQPLFADTGVFTCKKGPAYSPDVAKNLLLKTQSAYDTVKTLQAEFTQHSYLSALETSETSSGTLKFSKPGKMKWEYDSPEEQIFLIIDTNLWFYQAIDKQVVVDKFSKFLITDLPVAFILGIGDLSKSFNIDKACLTESGVGTIFYLIPKDKKTVKGATDERLEKFELIVSNKNYLPQAAKIYDLASNVNAFYLNEQKINEGIPDETYDPKFPDGTDIDDRRNQN